MSPAEEKFECIEILEKYKENPSGGQVDENQVLVALTLLPKQLAGKVVLESGTGEPLNGNQVPSNPNQKTPFNASESLSGIQDQEQLLGEIYQILPWKFIQRLLVSEREMKIVGITIWSLFTKYPNLVVEKKKIAKKIEIMSRLLEEFFTVGQEDENGEIVELILSSLIRILMAFDGNLSKIHQYFPPLTLKNIAAIDHHLALVFADELIKATSLVDLPAGQIISNPSPFLCTCARVMLHEDIYLFNAIHCAINILSTNIFDKNLIDSSHIMLGQLKLACRRVLASKLSKNQSESVLVLISLLCNHYSIKSGTSILIPKLQTPKDIATEKLWLKKAKSRASIGKNDKDVDDIIDKLQSMQQTSPTSRSHGDAKQETLKTSEKKNKTSNNRVLTPSQFLILVIHLVGAEIRFMLDTTSKMLPETERQSLPLFYSLLQDSISLLLDESVELDRSQTLIESLRQALFDTYFAVGAFLIERWDIFVEGQERDEDIIDNLTTLFSFGAYCAWIDIEPISDPQEIERMAPLVVWMQKKRHFKSMKMDVYEMSFGLLSLVTSEQSSLETYTKLKGHTYLIEAFASVRDPSKQLGLASVLLNIVATLSSRDLELQFTNFLPLLVTLDTIFSHYSTLKKSQEEPDLLAHVCVLYLFLYRSSQKYQANPLPLQPIMRFVLNRPFLPEDLTDLWYLTISALTECKAAQKMDLIGRSNYFSKLDGLLDGLLGCDDEVLACYKIKQAVDSVENQLDTILDQSKEGEKPVGAEGSKKVAAATAPVHLNKDQQQQENTDLFSRLKNKSSAGGQDAAAPANQAISSTPSTPIAPESSKPSKTKIESETISNTSSFVAPMAISMSTEKTAIDPPKVLDIPKEPKGEGKENTDLAIADPLKDISKVENTLGDVQISDKQPEDQNGWDLDDVDIPNTLQDKSVNSSKKSSRQASAAPSLDKTITSDQPNSLDGPLIETTAIKEKDAHEELPSGPEMVNPSSPDLEAQENEKSEMVDAKPVEEEVAAIKKSLALREAQLMESKQQIAELYNQIDVLNAQIKAATALAKKSSENPSGNTDQSKIIAEKDASIAGLLKEGENLSKEVLKANMNVKKMRKEAEEIKRELADKQKKMDEKASQIEALTKKCQDLKDNEHKLEESLKDTTESMMRQSKRATDIEREFIKSQQEKVDLEAKVLAYEKRIKELGDADATAAEKSEALSQKALAHEELKVEYEQLDTKFRELQNKHQDMVVQSQLSLATLQHEQATKEESLQNQIKNFEYKLAAAEAKLEENSIATQEATAPLLAQLSEMESSHLIARTDWSNTEITLIQRCQAAEKDRNDVWKASEELSQKVATLEESLKVQLEQRKSEKELKDLELKYLAEIETLKKRIESGVKRIAELENDLASSKEFLRMTKLEMTSAHEEALQQFKERYNRKNSIKTESELSPTSPSSTPETSRNAASGNVIGNLTSQLKHTKAQVLSLELQIKHLTESRDEITSHMVELEGENETFKEKLSSMETLKTELLELDEKYNTVLELLGEKEERIEELNQDIVDMKEAFRAQILAPMKN